MKIIIIIVEVFILCGLISCSKHDDAGQGEYEIRLEYKNFHPVQLTVPIGTTVLFNNVGGGGTHNLAGSSFKSGNIIAGETYSHKFDAVGIYTFNCLLHSSNQEQTSIRVE